MSPPNRVTFSRRRLLRRSTLALAAIVAVARSSNGVGAAYTSTAPVSPDWEAAFHRALGGRAMGYAYAVAREGRMIAGGGIGLARSSFERQNPSQPWTLDTLSNIASISKPITAVAIMSLVQTRGIELLESPFWPVLAGSGRFSGPSGAGVDRVTIRQLLTQRSGLAPNGTIYPREPSVDEFLAGYLQQDVVAPPGSTFRYSNTNFTILQAIYEVLVGGAPGSFATLVLERVLAPLGVDVANGAITPVPRPDTEALDYSDANDTRPGQLWRPIPCTGAGGWLATATGLLQFLTGIRANALLNPDVTAMMFADRLGWYPGTSRYGTYYHHNGGLFNAKSPRQELHTGIVQFPHGYDAVLLVNSGPARPIRLMAETFDGE
jgi:CubicO group peptidase (beta-lactamase class C family)